MDTYFRIFRIFFLIGLTSFGGPTAHIGYLHNKFVKDNNWFSAKEFFELLFRVLICFIVLGLLTDVNVNFDFIIGVLLVVFNSDGIENLVLE